MGTDRRNGNWETPPRHRPCLEVATQTLQATYMMRQNKNGKSTPGGELACPGNPPSTEARPADSGEGRSSSVFEVPQQASNVTADNSIVEMDLDTPGPSNEIRSECFFNDKRESKSSLLERLKGSTRTKNQFPQHKDVENEIVELTNREEATLAHLMDQVDIVAKIIAERGGKGIHKAIQEAIANMDRDLKNITICRSKLKCAINAKEDQENQKKCYEEHTSKRPRLMDSPGSESDGEYQQKITSKTKKMIDAETMTEKPNRAKRNTNAFTTRPLTRDGRTPPPTNRLPGTKGISNTTETRYGGTPLNMERNMIINDQPFLTVKKRVRRRPQKADAVVVKPTNILYADMVKKIKNEITIEEMGVNLKAMRKTQNGDLLLEMSKETKKEDVGRLQEAIKNVIGSNGMCKRLAQTVGIEIRDFDETTDRQEVIEALRREIGDNPDLFEVYNIRKDLRGTASVRARICMKEATNLLKKGRIKIGWVFCRVRKRTQVIRCYRCHEFGHVRAKCEGIDRTDQCMTCGNQGHKARNCAEEPNCIVCKTKELNFKHFPGATGCSQATAKATSSSWNTEYYK